MMLLSSMTMMGANVKVLKTQPQAVDFDLMGMYVTVAVQLQLSGIGKEECACVVLMNNDKWNDQNITFQRLVERIESMCVGDTLLNAVKGPATTTLPVIVPIEKQYLTGKDSALYLKAYVVDVKRQNVIAQGQTVRYVPDRQATSNQMIHKAAGIAGKMFGAISGLTNGFSSALDECPDCHGLGTCYYCRDKQSDPDFYCVNCNGKGRCVKCNGTGHYKKEDKSGDEKKSKSKQTTGGSLLDLFGF